MKKKTHTAGFILKNTVFSLSNIGVSIIYKAKSSVVMSLPSYLSVHLQKKRIMVFVVGFLGGFLSITNIIPAPSSQVREQIALHCLSTTY